MKFRVLPNLNCLPTGDFTGNYKPFVELYKTYSNLLNLTTLAPFF
jgi:hypothetical protein